MDQKIKQDYCIGTNIKSLRNKSGYTQNQMSIKLQTLGINMSRDYYAHIENGSYNIRVSELSALRKIFKCTFDDFFQGY